MLLVVGLGINAKAHITAEAKAAIKQADIVFFLVADTTDKKWLFNLNPNTSDLSVYYKLGKKRQQIYIEMVQHVISALQPSSEVCVVFYGHPGVFVMPGHEMVRQARELGFQAQLLPGISADACLYADLNLDPSVEGCQMYEATDFLIRPRRWDPTANLILWQVGVVGHMTSPADPIDAKGTNMLTELLLQHYKPEHEIVIYEAATHMLQSPRIDRIPLKKLNSAILSPISTLYVPPAREAMINERIAQKLGL